MTSSWRRPECGGVGADATFVRPRVAGYDQTGSMVERALRRISGAMYRFLAQMRVGRVMRLDGTFRLAGRIDFGAKCLWIFMGVG
jgi:hypothetical protein